MMTREEATEILRERQRYCKVIADHANATVKADELREIEAIDIALSVLRPVSREQVEKVWEKCQHSRVCGTCKVCVGGRYQQANFCAACGAPLTDEAVEMVMERLEALYDL